MLNSKERADLRAMANSLEAIVQIGKQGINENLIRQADDALLAREIVKMRVLQNSPVSASEAAQRISSACGADIVQVIGTKFVLYRRNPEKPVIRI